MNLFDYNRNAWNVQSLEGCRWSTPLEDAVIRKAQEGKWAVRLTPNRDVPQRWFPAYPNLSGVRILALASGGGQQVPVFAAAGADVTSFEGSDVQLGKDEEICARHHFPLKAIQGDMADLSELPDSFFDFVFNPVSNVFAEDLAPIWRECHRVLRPGGRLLCGFTNPAFFLFDHAHLEETGEAFVVHRLPYSDVDSCDEETLSDLIESQQILEHSHSWEAQIGGQCDAGFAILGFYEDDWDEESTRLQGWMPMFAATFAEKR